jgi:hypothetical protein
MFLKVKAHFIFEVGFFLLITDSQWRTLGKYSSFGSIISQKEKEYTPRFGTRLLFLNRLKVEFF